ncbi:MAG TPA: IclR family transcriptional regulator [Gaiellaceae bacterium]|nr:IclR family transcriptional regulator [Gaiellaceae bacterium]
MVAGDATSLRRGIEILLALGGDDAVDAGGLGVQRVAELVGREKSQVSRTLRTLAEYGLVDRDARTRAYRLGPRLFALGTRALEPKLVASAPPLLARLVRRLGETAHLSVLRGGEVLTLLSESPAQAIRVADRSGLAVPAHCTSAGHALLLDHDAAGLASLFPGGALPPAGPAAPRSVSELARRLDADRGRGFALVDEEFEAGLVGVAAPVRAAHGRIVAALNVSGPKFRFADRLDAAGREVRDAADELSGLLGWRADEGEAAA